ncbi:MAG: 3-hydroxyacyl-CoA dehydrogenase NAD-binding domain-containing protein, partial [Pseudomonadota bacterium]
MSFPDPGTVKRVASLGAGPIGGGWTAHFLARGFDVTAYIHSIQERDALLSVVDTAWRSLKDLGLAQGASRDRLTVTTDLNEAVSGAGFVQESAPERLEIKQTLYEQLGQIVPPNVVIGSSTSGLTMSEIQARCTTPERCVIGHPFNPPYLLPLVEIVGGADTAPEAVEWASAFYESAGKAPLVMKKEVPGFVATRLQEALWREALHMVANGEATPEDIDIALRNGPAPRMVVQGQCMAFHVACGEGGMATNLDQFGPALKWPWTRLNAP